MRTAILLALPLLLAPAAAQAWQKRIVNLDPPGSLEALERDNPAHHAKVLDAIEAAQAATCDAPLQLYKALAGTDAAPGCRAHHLLTSMPPKRRVSVDIDDVTYTVNAVQYRLAPARRFPLPVR